MNFTDESAAPVTTGRGAAHPGPEYDKPGRAWTQCPFLELAQTGQKGLNCPFTPLPLILTPPTSLANPEPPWTSPPSPFSSPPASP